MILRPYQIRAVDYLQNLRRGFIHSPAGSGKTIMAARSASLKARCFDRIVWLANTREQCDQAHTACALMDWPEGTALDIHCVAAQPDTTGASIIIMDEAHHAPAASWAALVYASKAIVWGFSATPWSGDPARDHELRLFFESNFLEIPRDEVKGGGSITEGKVYIHDLDTPKAFDASIGALAAEETLRRVKKYPQIPADEHHRRVLWQFTAEAVKTNFVRNKTITALARGTNSTLILVGSIEHGEKLTSEIDGAVMVFSRMPKKKRAAAIEGLRSGALRVMVATSLADEGLDVPRASVLILAAGGRSAGKLEQRAGRVMRPHHSKTFGTVHDFLDRGSSMAHAQARARIKTYKALGYKIQ